MKKLIYLLLLFICFTLVACETKQVLVTYDSDGGTAIESVYVALGERAPSPQDPIKEGYDFLGWYYGNDQWSFLQDRVTENITLRAKWSAKKCTITFDTDGGSTIAPITQDYNSVITMPSNPTKEGYTFVGWDKQVPSTMPLNGLTLKAIWLVNEYTITFDTDGGSTINPITQDYNSVITMPNNPTKEGYTFKGWDKEIPATMPASDITLKALWESNHVHEFINGVCSCGEKENVSQTTFTVTFDSQGGTEVTSVTVEKGSKVSKPANPTKEGYTFAGWYFEEEQWSFIGYVVTEDMTLTAKWTINQYTITFDTDGGTYVAPITQDYNSEIVKPANPEKLGYTFAGWDQTFPQTMPLNGLTLKALWEVAQYAITFIDENSNVLFELNVSYGEVLDLSNLGVDMEDAYWEYQGRKVNNDFVFEYASNIELNLIKNGGFTYKTLTTESPTNWNELNYVYQSELDIIEYINSSLFSYDYKFDANGEIIPGEFVVKYEAATKLEDVSSQYAGLAKWDISYGESARAYKITLRKDLKWDDGNPINATDFVYSMQEQLNPLFNNSWAENFYKNSNNVNNFNIVGAKEYLNGGIKGWFSSHEIYDEYTIGLDEKLEFSLGGEKAKTYVRSWLESQLGVTDYTATEMAEILIKYFFAGILEKEDFLALEGKTLAEIKADSELNSIWETIINWWKTVPNEELHWFITEYNFPAMSFDTVGMFAGDGDGINDEYEIIIILEKAVQLLKEDGSLSYAAIEKMPSLPLVKRDLYELCKVAPTSEDGLWTTVYNTSLETSASWGPYKMVEYEEGRSYRLTKNENWYGYSLAENEGLYQTTDIICETIVSWEAAWQKFKAGEIDNINIDSSIASEYKTSDRAYYKPNSSLMSLHLQVDKNKLKNNEENGINKTILSYEDFRKALSLAINNADYINNIIDLSVTELGLFNSVYYNDVDSASVYRNTDEAKQVLCDIYGVDVSQFDSLDDAVNSITGYDLTLARQLVESAYQQALADGEINENDVVELTFGTSTLSEKVIKSYEIIKNAWLELVKGTSLEGRLQFSDDKEYGSAWIDYFQMGEFDVCIGGWKGEPLDPGDLLLVYLAPSYMFSQWDTENTYMTFTMKGVGENGEDITETMSLMDWWYCLNGEAGYPYDWSAKALEQSQRLPLIAALEKEVLKVYNVIPLYSYAEANLMSYKVDYITTKYNSFVEFGGIKYMTYNFNDAQWAEEIAKNPNGFDYH